MGNSLYKKKCYVFIKSKQDTIKKGRLISGYISEKKKSHYIVKCSSEFFVLKRYAKKVNIKSEVTYLKIKKDELIFNSSQLNKILQNLFNEYILDLLNNNKDDLREYKLFTKNIFRFFPNNEINNKLIVMLHDNKC